MADSTMYAEGLRLAVLTSFIRLLELRLEELEDPQTGTGSLESDLKLLQVRTRPAQRAACAVCAVILHDQIKAAFTNACSTRPV